MGKKAELRKSGVYAVLRYESSLVLIKKARGPFKGMWDLPGGKIDFGETPEEALEREIEEETGLKLKSFSLYDAVSYVYKTKKEKFDHVGIIYECRAKSLKGLLTKADGQDSLGAEVFTKKEILKLKLTPLAKKALV